MATLVRMPAVSANAKDAVLVEWLVGEGDAVRRGDSLGGIETDKAVVDLEAECDGRVGKLLVGAGARVAVGAPLAVLLEQGETAADVPGLPEVNGADAGARDGAGRIMASPLARRLAADAGLDLRTVAGSGPGGRIVKRDIERARQETPSRRQSPSPVPPPVMAGEAAAASGGKGQSVQDDTSPTEAQAGTDIDVIPHTAMRLAIARRLTESKTTIPHFYLRGRCRADALLALREQLNAVAPRRISLNDLAVRAAACALRDVPEMNVTWAPQGLHRHRRADIAVAVATDKGLITPIVRAADTLGVAALSETLGTLVARAREGRLAPVEYEGGSFGVSNLGMHGVMDFAAIINPPQSAMLALGAATREPMADGDAVVVATVLRYTLAVDHRAIDGALAARWLARFTRYMEQPMALLL